jgi:hypothetical protein
MFEKTSKLAEKVASSLSRRHFLGSVGPWAGATALAMAGVLTTTGSARAASKTCCVYELLLPTGPAYSYQCVEGACPPPMGSSILVSSSTVADCKKCRPGTISP